MSLTSILAVAKTKQTATVFWFHGLGDSGSGWQFLADELASIFPHVKWIFPNAPIRKMSINGGCSLPAWFDISGADKLDPKTEDSKGMLASVSSVVQLIRDEINNGIPSERIIVGGFSQGGALSLLTGLTSEFKFAGTIVCSSWLGLSSEISTLASDANRQTPILVCHGDRDPVIKHEFSEKSVNILQSLNYNVSFKTYRGLGHSVNAQELGDIAHFLQETIPSTQK